MKLSIGIIVCDKDYNHLSSLLKQIIEKVIVEHEVIVIDNREQYVNEPVSWTPTYQFGYNAYQFAARAKVIEHAKGEYIWFIDGDDELVDTIRAIPYDEDIIVHSNYSDPIGLVRHENKVYTKDLFTYPVSGVFEVILWNKFIKRSLFQTQFPPIKIVTNEDALWYYSALKNAKSVRTIDKIYYHHTIGLANKKAHVTEAEMRHLITGYAEMRRLMRDLIEDDEFYRKVIIDVNVYLLHYLEWTDEPDIIGHICMSLLTYQDCKDAYQGLLIPAKQRAMLKQLVLECHGKDKAKDLGQLQREVIFEDGHKEMYTFNMEVEE